MKWVYCRHLGAGVLAWDKQLLHPRNQCSVLHAGTCDQGSSSLQFRSLQLTSYSSPMAKYDRLAVTASSEPPKPNLRRAKRAEKRAG